MLFVHKPVSQPSEKLNFASPRLPNLPAYVVAAAALASLVPLVGKSAEAVASSKVEVQQKTLTASDVREAFKVFDQLNSKYANLLPAPYVKQAETLEVYRPMISSAKFKTLSSQDLQVLEKFVTSTEQVQQLSSWIDKNSRRFDRMLESIQLESNDNPDWLSDFKAEMQRDLNQIKGKWTTTGLVEKADLQNFEIGMLQGERLVSRMRQVGNYLEWANDFEAEYFQPSVKFRKAFLEQWNQVRQANEVVVESVGKVRTRAQLEDILSDERRGYLEAQDAAIDLRSKLDSVEYLQTELQKGGFERMAEELPKWGGMLAGLSVMIIGLMGAARYCLNQVQTQRKKPIKPHEFNKKD